MLQERRLSTGTTLAQRFALWGKALAEPAIEGTDAGGYRGYARCWVRIAYTNKHPPPPLLTDHPPSPQHTPPPPLHTDIHTHMHTHARIPLTGHDAGHAAWWPRCGWYHAAAPNHERTLPARRGGLGFVNRKRTHVCVCVCMYVCVYVCVCV